MAATLNRYELQFSTPQGIVAYKVQSDHWIKAVNAVRENCPEVKPEYRLIRIRIIEK